MPTSSLPPESPPLCHGREEELAALADGGLPDGERAEMLEHLSSCPVCYEIFTELAGWQDDESLESSVDAVSPESMGDVLPPPPTQPAFSFPWAAAAGLLVAVAALFLWRIVGVQGPTGSEQWVTSLTQGSPFQPGPDWSEVPWKPPRSSEALSAEAASFRLGARWVDTRLALKIDDLETARLTLRELLAVVRMFEDPEAPEVESVGLGLLDRLDAQGSRSSFESDLQVLESKLEALVSRRLSPDAYGLGMLCEAARLAAAAERTEFFQDRAIRLQLKRAMDTAASAIPEVPRPSLDAPSDALDWHGLARFFTEASRHYGLISAEPEAVNDKDT